METFEFHVDPGVCKQLSFVCATLHFQYTTLNNTLILEVMGLPWVWVCVKIDSFIKIEFHFDLPLGGYF